MDVGTRQSMQRLPGCWTEARVSRVRAMALTPQLWDAGRVIKEQQDEGLVVQG